MKTTLSQLKHVIKKSIFENTEPVRGKVYFAYRSLLPENNNIFDEFFPGKNPGHSWIIIKDPETNIVTTYSAKSGAVFGPQLLLKRLGIGRGDSVDEVFSKVKKKYEEGEITSEEMQEFFENLQWENLVKIKNWESDALSQADIITSIMPQAGDSQDDVNAAIQNIKISFENYNNDTPYDPLPGRTYFYHRPESGHYTRNSNSFSYTLLRQAFRDLGGHSEVIKRVGTIKLDLPGWGKIVGGVSLNEKRENKMKISRKKLRKIINEFLDTSRPIVDQPIPDLSDLTATSVYNQLTNSERAAFISAMGIAGDAGISGTSQELNEGEVIQFPRRRPQEEEDLDGDITPGDLEIINREKHSSQSVDLDDLDAMFDMYLDNLEKKRSEEDMGIMPIKGSVLPHFYDRD